MWTRSAAWCVILAGLALAAATPPIPAREPMTWERYTILAADFHVHSFPGDGGLPPWEIGVEARRRGLDVVALTNHNSQASWRLTEMLGWRRKGAMMLPGIELTAAGYHMAAVSVQAPVAWRQHPAAAAAAIQAQGGIAIAAHPLSPRSRFDARALDAIDGFEAASSNDLIAQLMPFTERAVTHRPSLAAIGASDFHYYAPIGVSRTFLFVSERTAAGVLDAVRRGRTVACDGGGATYGPVQLAAAVSSECRRVASARPEGWSAVEAVGTTTVWLGLVVLVALGPRERALE
jgi:hypothetical protein